MSITATTWVFERAPVTDPISLLILLCLADHANADGSGTYPSQATIARWSRTTQRTVRSKLVELEAAGIIARGDQHLASSIPQNRRPVVWSIPALDVGGNTLAVVGNTILPPESLGGNTILPSLDVVPDHESTPTSREDVVSGRKPVSSKGEDKDSREVGELTQVTSTIPADRCPTHINHAYPPPCVACRDARQQAATATTNAANAKRLRAARERARDDRARVNGCDYCDTNGRTPSGRVCNHAPSIPSSQGADLVRAAIREATQ